MNQKKRFHRRSVLWRFILTCLVLLLPVSLAGCGSSAVTISIAGKEFKLNGKLQACIDSGLITTNAGGDKLELTNTMQARTASFESYWLGNSDRPRRCPAAVCCYNPGSSKKSIYECSIMSFTYYVDADRADQAPVLINGIDFWGMTEDDALAALKDKGIKDVDYDEMHERHYNVCKKGKVIWRIESEKGGNFHAESENPQKKVVDFDDDTYYISKVSVDISGSLNLKSK